MDDNPAFLLASQSPRRRDLLTLTGWSFRVAPAAVDETLKSQESPGHYVLRLAEAKVRAVAHQAALGEVVLGADTAVVDEGEILGKPMDHMEAVKMLRRLRGRTHQVYSAIAVMRFGDGELFTDLCVTEVPMRSYRDGEIAIYVDSGDPMDKAGAYAIQHAGFHPVAWLQGCFANVVGLPLCHLVRTLAQISIRSGDHVPARCQEALQYECPVFESVLRAHA